MVTLRVLTASCDANTSCNDMAWQEKSCCTSFLSSCPKEFYDAIAIKWHYHWHKWHYIKKKLCFNSLWSYGHKECNGAIANAISITCCCTSCVTWPKSHVALHFDHLDVRSVVVPLTSCLHYMMLIAVLMASYDQRSHAPPHFCHLGLKKVSFMMP